MLEVNFQDALGTCLYIENRRRSQNLAVMSDE